MSVNSRFSTVPAAHGVRYGQDRVAGTPEADLAPQLSPELKAPPYVQTERIPGTLREQLHAGLSYFHVSEPSGFHLVAARVPAQARQLVFDRVKDELASGDPLVLSDVVARPVTLDDLAVYQFLGRVPRNMPVKPAILDATLSAGQRAARIDPETPPGPRMKL